MSTIRVMYKLRCRPDDLLALRQAWRDVVQAHARQGHQTLESVFLVDAPPAEGPAPQAPPEFIVATAISRWQSRQAWQAQRTDEADPQAYARFRSLCTVEERQVFEELDLLIQGQPAT
ncbi:hypothetical protein DL240_14415 [Lujinxingia litoralis]|uniref:ABM domain-containing protein n=1 Tax=Lujinxingia litoralis TaxID=2211119 RepID=A0A328C4E9_9DELT|nr:hypothetical protein [Lujinxingia litoralis]RAL20874.1 hypothetical protein DL240_14415 [Lujinxingia litoralis]